MSLSEPARRMDEPFDDPAQRSSTRSASDVLSYLAGGIWPVLKTMLGAGGLFSLLWAAYTYSAQQVEQRRQDFLQAFNVVDTHVGDKFIKLVTDTIKPISTTEDERWRSARSRADNAEADIAQLQTTNTPVDFERFRKDMNDKQVATLEMQAWIVENVLVKGNGKDNNIHNYQNALNSFRFLYWYAKADACNAAVVVFKFQKTAFDFWYYFPGEYDFSGYVVKGDSKLSATTEGPEQLADLDWGIKQANQCAESLKLPSLPLIQHVQERIFSSG
jgi:hypothetical protein